MKRIPSFEQFKETFTNSKGRPERRFLKTYGNVTFEEAYPKYVAEIGGLFGAQEKIEQFEKFLKENGIEETQSRVSESRYYRWQGMKYRFSAHVYPTGSMTSDYCIDFAADPQLIHQISF